MADTRVDREGATEAEEGLREHNRRIIEWIREQRAEPQTEEDSAWAERFRRAVTAHPFSLAEDAGG